ncbi:MAG: hypothetical protein V1872_01390 [bacterium]
MFSIFKDKTWTKEFTISNVSPSKKIKIISVESEKGLVITKLLDKNKELSYKLNLKDKLKFSATLTDKFEKDNLISDNIVVKFEDIDTKKTFEAKLNIYVKPEVVVNPPMLYFEYDLKLNETQIKKFTIKNPNLKEVEITSINSPQKLVTIKLPEGKTYPLTILPNQEVSNIEVHLNSLTQIDNGFQDKIEVKTKNSVTPLNISIFSRPPQGKKLINPPPRNMKTNKRKSHLKNINPERFSDIMRGSYSNQINNMKRLGLSKKR